MKKYLAVLIASLLIILAGCGPENGTAEQTTKAASLNAISADEIDTTVGKSDQDAAYDESSATKITLTGASASISGNGASQKDGVVTIQQEGTYLVSGTLENGQLVVDAADTEKVQIVLQNVSIDCSDHAALFIKQADKVFLTLAEGTENTLSSGSSYALGDDDSNVDGVIFSRADLTMNGSGSLAVNAAYKHAVVSKDDLVVTGGQYAIKAENGGGLYGKDCVKITGGAFTIATGTDAIQANNAEKADQGYVYISGGTFDLTAGTDAVQAETVLRIDGGTFQITSGGGSANASIDKSGKDSPGWGMWGPQSEQNPSQDAESTDTYGSYPYTSMPRCVAAFATSTPIAPRPITPSFFPCNSCPANAFFAFSASLAMFPSSSFSCTQLMPPMISLDASSIPAITSSFTPFALAPGVLNTTIPCSAHFSSGILFTPAPALAIAFRSVANSISCIAALLTRIASAVSGVLTGA